MIQAQELRIGNLVLFYGKIDKVESIGKYAVSFENGLAKYTLPNLKPIPLTEDILLKGGFEDVSSYNDFRLSIKNDKGFDTDVRIEISLRSKGRVFTQ